MYKNLCCIESLNKRLKSVFESFSMWCRVFLMVFSMRVSGTSWGALTQVKDSLMVLAPRHLSFHKPPKWNKKNKEKVENWVILKLSRSLNRNIAVLRYKCCVYLYKCCVYLYRQKEIQSFLLILSFWFVGVFESFDEGTE